MRQICYNKLPYFFRGIVIEDILCVTGMGPGGFANVWLSVFYCYSWL